MSRIIIETFERKNGGFLAVAHHEGESEFEGTLRSDQTEAGAATQALDALLRKQQQSPQEDPLDVARKHRRAPNVVLRLEYQDILGNHSTRLVTDVRLSRDERHLYAFDNGEPRTFLVERIQSLELA